MTDNQSVREPIKRLDPADAPHPPENTKYPLPGTIANLEYILREHDISSRFNVITKELHIIRAGGSSASLGDVASIANLNRFPTNWLEHFLLEAGLANPLNPVRDWITETPWDGKDRFEALCETVQVHDDYPTSLKVALLRKWLLSAVAAALLDGPFKARGVLTLQGAQGIGKTSWVSSLVPEGPLRREAIKLDHHLDGSNKDSIILAIGAWITEIGELDSSFKKDVARLKGFLTRDSDKLRPPFAKKPIYYPRRTVFTATVNDEQFLIDHTGNSRWWTLGCERLIFDHGICMQQLFAQLADGLSKGREWWLTQDQERQLSEYNLRHRNMSAIAERVRDHVNLERSLAGQGNYMTPTQLLIDMGILNPTNPQAKECGTVLREILGPPRRVHGRDQWRVAVGQRPRDVF